MKFSAQTVHFKLHTCYIKHKLESKVLISNDKRSQKRSFYLKKANKNIDLPFII